MKIQVRKGAARKSCAEFFHYYPRRKNKLMFMIIFGSKNLEERVKKGKQQFGKNFRSIRAITF